MNMQSKSGRFCLSAQRLSPIEVCYATFGRISYVHQLLNQEGNNIKYNANDTEQK